MDQSHNRYSDFLLSEEIERKNQSTSLRSNSSCCDGYEPEELDEDVQIINDDLFDGMSYSRQKASHSPSILLEKKKSEKQVNISRKPEQLLNDDDLSIEYNTVKNNKIDRIIPNAWDSSPSTVDYNEDQDDKSFYTHDEAVHFEDNSSSRTHNMPISFQDIDDDENDSDMELTQRSRQIQLDLRLREMTELALEAERAAAAGDEMFRGNATKFELGLGLDVDLPLSVPSATTLTPKSNDINMSRRLLEPKNRIWNSRCVPFSCNNNFGSSSPVEMCKGRKIIDSEHLHFKSSPSRQRSAPSTLYNSPRTASISSMTSHFPSLMKSHKSPAPMIQRIDKIHILNLRHIDDVIPNFEEMQRFMKMHLTRAGVEEIADSMTKHEKIKNSSIRSTSVRVSGFQQILRSFSSNSYNQKTISIDEECVKDEKAHGLASGSQDDIENFDQMDPDCSQISDTNSSEKLYVDTLASETCNMKSKLRVPSPLPAPPYTDDVKDGPTVVYVRTPSSPWLNFLSNMTPVRKSSLDISQRRIFNFTENTPSKSVVSTPSFQRNRKVVLTVADRLRSQEPPLFHFDNIETQNDEVNDEVQISTDTFTSRIRRKSLSDLYPYEVNSIGTNADDPKSRNQIGSITETFPIKEALTEPSMILLPDGTTSYRSKITEHFYDQQILSREPVHRHDSSIVEKLTSDVPIHDNKNKSLSCYNDDDNLLSLKDAQTIPWLSNIDVEYGSSSYEIYEKLTEKEERPTSAHRITTPLTNSLSIINLMVEKVPSVIERLNPLRKSKQSKYKDDVSFVENFMYVGIHPKNRSAETKHMKQYQKENPMYRNETSCFDISCKSMFESLNCLHGDETEAATIEPSASFIEPTSKFGNIQTPDRRKKLLIGNRLFQPPSLKFHQSRSKLADVSEDLDTVHDETSLDSM